MEQGEVDEALEQLDAVREEWMSRPGVVAVEVGLLQGPDGALTEDVGIKVTVREKLAIEDVPPEERFPTNLGRFPVQLREGRPGPQVPGR